MMAASDLSELQRIQELTHRRSVAVILMGVDGVLHGLKHAVVCGEVPKHRGISCKTQNNTSYESSYCSTWL